MSTALQPNGNPVKVGRVTLRTPGLQGVANSLRPGVPGMRAAELTTDMLEDALTRQRIEPQETIEITGTRELPVSTSLTRSTSFGEPAIIAEVPEPNENFGQFVLFTDEAGVITWNFARGEKNRVDATRGTGTRTYIIPRGVAPAGRNAESRGLIRIIGKKLLKVLVFPLIDPILGRVGDYFVQKWEHKNRAYRIRTFSPDNYQSSDVQPLQSDDWNNLSKGRALLMVHGTISQASSAFSQMPREYVASLNDKYQGRVFAFDHFTLSEDPLQNTAWLLQQVPKHVTLELDIICHSRGGLVSRVLAERSAASGDCPLRVRKIVFAGVPNAGTILTDAEYVGSFLDSYTNILNLFVDAMPETGVLETLDAVIAVAKQLSLDTMKGLGGLQAMQPTGQFLKNLNHGQKDDKSYFAISSDFEPKENPGFKAYVANRLADKIFGAKNDLVVPTSSCYETNGSGFFPIDSRCLFPPSAAVHHCNYFAQQLTRDTILSWLS